MSKYIDAEKLKSIIKVQIKERKEWMKDIDRSDRQDQLWSDLNEEDMSILHTITSLQQEQPKKRLIQVKCLYPHDESWQKNKVYTCEVWHHGDLNRDFWDVYYDYRKDPRYVQFSSIELLNEEFVVVQEQPEVDLEKEIEKWTEGYEDDWEEWSTNDIISTAHHFYELGLKAKKGE